MGKKGQSMSTNTIVLLILALAILVILILGFTMGWDKVAPWVSRANVDNVKDSCEAACATNSFYDFCTAEKTLRDKEKNKIITTCAVLSTEMNFQKYGIKPCEIDCQKPCAKISINAKKGSITLTSGYDVSALADDLVSGQKCLISK